MKKPSITELWLKRLFVKPELKGKGVGSKLLSAVEEYAAGKGIIEFIRDLRFGFVKRRSFIRQKDLSKSNGMTI